MKRGNDFRRKGWNSVLWRLTREKWLQWDKAALDEYEKQWIDLYGPGAQTQALDFTEPFFKAARDRNLTVEDVWNSTDDWLVQLAK